MRDSLESRLKLVGVMFLFLLVLAIIFAVGSGFNVQNARKLNIMTSKDDVPLRGEILSSDGFSLAQSYRLYKVLVDTDSINPDKKDLFISLFAIYASMPKEEVQRRLKGRGLVVLSYNIDKIAAQKIKWLNSQFLANDVFIEFTRNGRDIPKSGFFIDLSGVNRIYRYADTLEPILGYVGKEQSGKLTIPEGIKGVEKYREINLEPKQMGLIKGKRDVISDVIYDKSTLKRERVDGSNVILSVNLLLQKSVEQILDGYAKKYNRDEIVAGVMDPVSGDILALASSNRFNPKKIQNPKFLNSSVIERPFEPGSIIKPLIFSTLLDKNLINPLSPINLEKGSIKVGKIVFRDDAPPPPNSIIQDIIIKSSNVGMIKLSRRLSSEEFHNALHRFGLGQASGIDLPYERDGIIPSISRLNTDIYKYSASFGYGLSATFMQLMRAYSAFVNDGKIVTPHLTKSIVDISGKRDLKYQSVQVISPATSRRMREILILAVERGTGKPAGLKDMVIGGKTGTARKLRIGIGYGDDYNGSFFGFAQKNQKSYVIGVVSFGNKEDYYGSQSAAPIFRDIVKGMQDSGFYK